MMSQLWNILLVQCVTMCMYGKTIVERTMSAMCCYIVYVCMVRQQWYIL